MQINAICTLYKYQLISWVLYRENIGNDHYKTLLVKHGLPLVRNAWYWGTIRHQSEKNA